MAQVEETKGQASAEKIPITEEVSPNKRGIPKVIFIDNVDAWVEKYNEDPLFSQMQELY